MLTPHWMHCIGCLVAGFKSLTHQLMAAWIGLCLACVRM
jgi:hypothetical protein